MVHCYVSLPEGILYSSMTGWVFQPLSWDYEIPNWTEKHVPNHQPDEYKLTYGYIFYVWHDYGFCV